MRYRTIVLIDLYYGLIDLYSSTRCDSLRRLSHREKPLVKASLRRTAAADLRTHHQASRSVYNSKNSPSSITFIFDTPSIGDSLSLSGGTDEALHPSDPSRPTPEVNGLAAGAKSNPPTPMLFSIGSAQACSTFSVSAAKTKRHRYFTRSSRRNNEG